MFDDFDTAESKIEGGQKPSEEDGKPTTGLARWSHVIAMLVFCLLYLPFQEHRWSFCVAIAGSYSVFVFGRALGSSLGDLDDFVGSPGAPRYVATLLPTHALILALVSLGAYLWSYFEPFLPSWATHAGHRGSLWMICGLLGVIYVGLKESSWVARKIKRRLKESES